MECVSSYYKDDFFAGGINPVKVLVLWDLIKPWKLYIVFRTIFEAKV